MTTREKAAAKAVAKDEDASNWDEEHADYQNGWLTRVDTILAAADAHDLAHGVHRIVIDDATVERAAKELCGYTLSGSWPCGECKDEARAMLSAAVK